MQDIPLLHVFNALCNLYKKPGGLTFIQRDNRILASGIIIVVGFHGLEGFYFNLQFITLDIL